MPKTLEAVKEDLGPYSSLDEKLIFEATRGVQSVSDSLEKKEAEWVAKVINGHQMTVEEIEDFEELVFSVYEMKKALIKLMMIRSVLS